MDHSHVHLAHSRSIEQVPSASESSVVSQSSYYSEVPTDFTFNSDDDLIVPTDFPFNSDDDLIPFDRPPRQLTRYDLDAFPAARQSATLLGSSDAHESDSDDSVDDLVPFDRLQRQLTRYDLDAFTAARQSTILLGSREANESDSDDSVDDLVPFDRLPRQLTIYDLDAYLAARQSIILLERGDHVWSDSDDPDGDLVPVGRPERQLTMYDFNAYLAASQSTTLLGSRDYHESDSDDSMQRSCLMQLALGHSTNHDELYDTHSLNWTDVSPQELSLSEGWSSSLAVVRDPGLASVQLFQADLQSRPDDFHEQTVSYASSSERQEPLAEVPGEPQRQSILAMVRARRAQL